MADDDKAMGGGCRCGAVRFEARGRPLWVAHCHCDDCRGATASAMATYAGFKRGQVRTVSGSPAGYHSSPGVTRRFCAECGTPLSYEGARWADEIHLFVCAFDEPAAFQPQAHVYVAEQVPWLALGDHLPRFQKTGSGGDSG